MKKAPDFDTVLAVTVLFLLIFGLVMITSIGVPKSIALSAPDVEFPNCGDANVDCYLLFKKHIIRLAIGAAAFLVAWKLPIRFWKKISPFIYVTAALLLFVVLFIGSDYGTIATNWLVFFDTSLQPSEFARLGLILYLAYWLSKREKMVESFSDGFIPFVLITSLLLFPVIMQNDFGSTLILGLIAVAIYFVAGAKAKHLGIGFLVALIASIIVISSVDHVRERFQGFMRIGEECLEDYCWQSHQANVAVGSGGFFGKGLTQGVQKSYWLPQASDDFIFAASAEELGFIRIVFVIIAYLIIAIRGYNIANNAPNSFEKYVAVGITTWITIQGFLNIAVNTALFPVTGVTLPFVSYGGSSLVSSLVGIAILLNISQRTHSYAYRPERRWNWRSRRSKPGRYRRA